MEWSVSNLFQNSATATSDICWSCYFKLNHFLDLDPAKWDDLKKGLNYEEDPIEKVQRGQQHSAPVGLGIWFQMLKIFLMIVLAGILIYLIVRLVSGKKIIPSRKKKKEESQQPEVANLPSALSPLEVLWQHFNQARDAEDYRECLRILYQIALKKLGDNGWVRTKHDKTNYEYLSELSGKLPASDFAVLTAIFEYSWYGDATIKSADFERYEPRFLDFIKRDDLDKQP